MSSFFYAIFIGFLLTGHVISTPTDLGAQQPDQAKRVQETREFFPELNSVQVETLLQATPLNHEYKRDVTTQLAPDIAATERIRRTAEAVSPSFGLEALHYYPSTEARQLSSVRLYNLTRALSTMEGLEYTVENSTTRKTLYKEAYAINNPESARRIPDPVVDTIPDEASLYALQDDDGFGRNMYKVTHYYDSGVIHVQMTNLTTIRIGFIPIVRSSNFMLHLVMLPTESGLYFYANGAMRTPAIMSGFEGRAQEGLRVRIDALYDWFVEQLETAIAEDL